LPPSIRYEDNIVYPSLRGEAAKGGVISVESAKELIINFNCLGVAKKTTLMLTFEIPKHLDITLYIDKECGKDSLIDKIGEEIVKEEENLGILKFLGFIFCIVIVAIATKTLYNVARGDNFLDALPIGKSLLSRALFKVPYTLIYIGRSTITRRRSTRRRRRRKQSIWITQLTAT